MRLTELDPHFLRCVVTADWPTEIVNDPAVGSASGSHIELRDRIVFHHVDSIAEAQGIQFLCPKCFAANGGLVGTHMVFCWSGSRGTPKNASPGPGRWSMQGTGFDDLTLNGDAVRRRRRPLGAAHRRVCLARIYHGRGGHQRIARFDLSGVGRDRRAWTVGRIG